MTTMFSDYHGDLMFTTQDTFLYVAPSSRFVTYKYVTVNHALLRTSL